MNYRKFGEMFRAVLDNESISFGDEDGLIAALQNVWSQIVPMSNKSWQKRFSKASSQILHGLLWKRDTSSGIPTFRDFHTLRPFTSAVNVSTLLLEFVTDLYLPEELLNDSDHAEIVRLAQMVTCLTDDLFLVSRSSDNADNHNMVNVIKNEYKISLEDAVKQVVDLHDFNLTQFLNKKFAMNENIEFYDLRIQFYGGLTHIMRGNLDWWTRDVIRDYIGYRKR